MRLEIKDKIYHCNDINNINDYINCIKKQTNLNWKQIRNYPNYIISEYGDIINFTNKQLLKLTIDNYNYQRVKLYNNKGKKSFRIHRLVYDTFVENINSDYQIHHKDENKSHNHYTNLEKVNISTHSIFHNNINQEEYLKECKICYDLYYKKNMLIEDIAKMLNFKRSNVSFRISRYRIFLSINKDIEKYKSLTQKGRRQILNQINNKELLDKFNSYKKIYDLYTINKLSMPQIAKKLNMKKSYIKNTINQYKIFLYFNKNIDQYKKLNEKDRRTILNKIFINEYKQKYKFYNKLYNMENKDIKKKYNLDRRMISKYKLKYKEYLIKKAKLIKDNKIEECKKIYELYKSGVSLSRIKQLHKLNIQDILIRLDVFKYFLYKGKYN